MILDSNHLQIQEEKHLLLWDKKSQLGQSEQKSDNSTKIHLIKIKHLLVIHSHQVTGEHRPRSDASWFIQ